MKKDKKIENIYLLMKERLGKYMVQSRFEEFLIFVSKQQQREVSTT